MARHFQRLYEFGPFRLDAVNYLLLRDGEPVSLKPKVFDTLLLLIQERERVLSRDELMNSLWPDCIVEENNLTQNISILRKVLGEGPDGQPYIETLPKRGYRFAAGVREFETESAEPIAQPQIESSLVIVEEHTNGYQDEVPAETAADATSGAESPSREIKRRKRSALFALTTFVVVGVIAFGFHKLTGPKPLPVLPALKIAKITATGKAYHPAISPNGKYVAFVSFEAGAQSLWIKQLATASNVQVIPPSKASYEGLTFSPDGNYLYYAGNEEGGRELALYQMPAFGGVIRKLLNSVDNMFALSPDGKRVAFVRDERDLVVVNLEGPGERTLATRQSPDFFSSAAWSPDGKRIACFGFRKSVGADVVEIELEGGAQKTLTQNWLWIQQVAWLPNGGSLVMIANDSQGSAIQLWQLSYPNGEIRRITTDLNDYSDLSLTADGSALVATQNNQVLNLWVIPNGDAKSARQITSSSMYEGGSGLAWTPDGKIVYSSFASGEGEPEIWIMDPDGSHQKQLTVDLGSNALGLSVSPDGRYIVFISTRGGSKNIWRIDIDGNNPKQLTNGGLVPFFSPDSKWVLYRDKQAVWKAPIDGGEPIKMTGPYSFVLDISPDGKLIAFSDKAAKKIGIASSDGPEGAKEKGLIRIFDRMPSTDQRPMPRWTPDGRALSYLMTANGASNIWLQPINSGPPKPVTDFKTDAIHYYAWSRDGKYLACTRGGGTSDVVMIRNFR